MSQTNDKSTGQDLQEPNSAAGVNPPSVLDRTVSVFRKANETIPLEDIPLAVAIDRIRAGTYQEQVNEVLAASPDRQQEVKRAILSGFIPSGRFERRAESGLLEHSGVIVLDIDDKTRTDETKAALAADPHVLAAFRSPRGGLKVLVPVVVIDGETGEERLPQSSIEHKAAMAEAFKHFDHLDLDPSGTDIARLCFFSVDRVPYVNAAAAPLETVVGVGQESGDGKSLVSSDLKPAGRSSFDDVIPHGKQYTTIGQIVGAVRRLGIGQGILTSIARAVYEKHLEHPNNWQNVESLVNAIAASPVEPHTSAEAMARRAVEAMREEGLEDSPDGSAPVFPWVPFPVEALPRSARDYVRAQSAAIGVAAAFVAVPLMSVLAAAVGNSYRIALKRSWTEISALWTMIVADSGSGKSPALQAALEPIYSLEREAKAQYEADRTAYESLDKDQKNVEPEPRRRRYRMSDATVESAVMVHAENPRSMSHVRDEGGGWLGAFNKYSGGASDMQSWIEMHGGRPVVVDRKTSNPPVLTIESPNVSVATTIQPAILLEQLGSSHFASGFAARLLLAEPPVTPRKWTEADVTHEVDTAYHRLVRGLYGFKIWSGDLPLAPGAKKVFVAHVKENGEKQHALPSGPLKAALSKHEALAARIALILHLADHVEVFGSDSATAPGPVSEDAMRRGVLLARWFRYETARLYKKYGIEEMAVDRDTRLAANLPETFNWQDVAKLWDVKKSGAFKVVQRLIDKDLAVDESHGSYRRRANTVGGLVDFGDFLNSDIDEKSGSILDTGLEVHEVHQSTSPDTVEDDGPGSREAASGGSEDHVIVRGNGCGDGNRRHRRGRVRGSVFDDL